MILTSRSRSTARWLLPRAIVRRSLQLRRVLTHPMSSTSARAGRSQKAGLYQHISQVEEEDDDVERGQRKAKASPSRPKSAQRATYTIGSAYSWLFSALRKQGAAPTAVAGVCILGEGWFASQPAVYLGRIVDLVSTELPAAAGSAVAVANQTTVGGAVWPVFGMIGLSLVGKEACTFGRKYIVEWQATTLQKVAFLEQACHLLAVRVDTLQDRRVGDLAVRLDKSVEGLVKLQKITFQEGGPNLATAAVALWLAYHEHWSVGIAMCGVLLAGSAVTSAQIRSQKGIR